MKVFVLVLFAACIQLASAGPKMAWQGAYLPTSIYNQGDVVTSAGSVYVSLAGPNTGNPPPTSPAWWTQIVGISQPIAFMASGDVTGTTGGTTTLLAPLVVAGLAGHPLPALAPGWLNFDGNNWQLSPAPTGGGGNVTQTIFTGSQALGTASIAANSCAPPISITAPGVLPSDKLSLTPGSDLSASTGYGPNAGDGLKIYWWLTAGAVNLRVCNGTAKDITPGAVSLGVGVLR